MTRLALRNPIAILMLGIGVIVFASVVVPRMSVDTFPELAPPVLVVGTLAPGLGPKDVEKTITWRIEKYVSATPGVDHVESASRKNLSVVFVWLKWGTDLNAAQGLVQQQVAFAMAATPKSLGILPPFVLQYDPSNAPVTQVAVWGGGLSGPQLYDYALNNIEPILEGIPGVASASLNGGRQRQINVVVDPVRAQARGVTSSDVAAAVRETNALMPSGELVSPKLNANVYTNGVPERIAQLGDAMVKTRDRRSVLVRDVARIEDGASPATQAVAINGESGVYLNVLRIPGGNTIEIVDAVNRVIEGLQRKLPPGMHVKAIFDQSTFVRTTYAGLRSEIVRALFLIACVILLFLQSVRAALIAAIAIPLSFAVILIVLSATGQTLNAFTLGGLTLAMGPLVDISVVVLEAVHRRMHHGASPAAAALEGTESVAIPALAATLTTVAVLLPVVLLEGLAKKLFGPLALTVAAAMGTGFVVSMVVTPVACRYFLANKPPGRLAASIRGGVDRFAEGYARALRVALPFRTWIMVAAALLVVGSVWLTTRLPSTFFPEIDEAMERVYVRLAPGTSISDSSRQIDEMAQMLARELPDEVSFVLTNVGAPKAARSAMASPNVGPHMGFIRLALVEPERRKRSQREIADHMRQLLVSRYPGVEFLQWPGGLVASVFSNGYLAPIAVELRGKSLEELEQQSRAVAEVARGVPGVRDVYPTLQLDYPEVRIDTDRQLAGAVGVSARTAAQTTLEATFGNINTPGVWVDAGNGMAYYVVTAYDAKIASDPAEIAQLPVRALEGGRAVALGTYASVRRSTGAIAIERNRLERAAHVLMQTAGRDVGSAAADLERRLRQDPRTRDLHFDFVGQVDLMRRTFSGLGLAIGLAIMVVFMIMASQFKSLRLPLVMLFTIPASLVGIVLALMAARQGISITALMGVLMVIGIAVSNGILLVDDANRRFLEGTDKLEAIVAAARTRFVPIAMTSLATIIGLLPTALGLEHGTESNQPLALAVVGGLTSSTLLSLFLVPSMFLVIARRPAPAEGPLPGAEAHPA